MMESPRADSMNIWDIIINVKIKLIYLLFLYFIYFLKYILTLVLSSQSNTSGRTYASANLNNKIY